MKNIRKFAGSRWVQHLLFWLLSYYVLLRIFATSPGFQKIDLIYTLIFISSLLPGIYLNLLVLIPRFLSRKMYFPYSILLLACIGASAEVNILTFSKLTDIILPGYYFISYYEFGDLLKFSLVFTGITTLLKLSRGWFMLMEARNELIKLEKENAETRLDALKNQVNPHFLFNSLAGIYSLVLQNSGKAPEFVLRLSDFLRYVLYETSAGMVDLSRELPAMNDYVELQKLRAGKSAEIEIQLPDETAGWQVAPLLLLPLIENCFKHGIKGAAGPVFARILISISGNRLQAYLENNMGVSADEGAPGSRGIGLVNLRNRLELLYPGNHELKISRDEERFIVTLSIPLNEKTSLPGH
ncbi:MAG: histidine kinase [Bacteroidetes bacterium]|nr:histidine kinase [Bacteroidota bacterium]